MKDPTNLFLTIPGQFPGLRARHVTASPRPSDRANGWPRSCVFRMFCKKTLELQRNQPAVLSTTSSLASSASPHELSLQALRAPPLLAPAPTSSAPLQLWPPPRAPCLSAATEPEVELRPACGLPRAPCLSTAPLQIRPPPRAPCLYAPPPASPAPPPAAPSAGVHPSPPSISAPPLRVSTGHDIPAPREPAVAPSACRSRLTKRPAGSLCSSSARRTPARRGCHGGLRGQPDDGPRPARG